MSVNLIYDVLDENGDYITSRSFPFQTPTELTHRVLATTDKAEQLAIIKAQLEIWSPDDPKHVAERMTEIKAMLDHPRITLGQI